MMSWYISLRKSNTYCESQYWKPPSFRGLSYFLGSVSNPIFTGVCAFFWGGGCSMYREFSNAIVEILKNTLDLGAVVAMCETSLFSLNVANWNCVSVDVFFHPSLKTSTSHLENIMIGRGSCTFRAYFQMWFFGYIYIYLFIYIYIIGLKFGLARSNIIYFIFAYHSYTSYGQMILAM